MLILYDAAVRPLAGPRPPAPRSGGRVRRLGRLVYRHRRAVVVLTLVNHRPAGLSAASIANHLSSGGWIVKDAESWAVQERLDEAFRDRWRHARGDLPWGRAARTQATRSWPQVDGALAPLVEDPVVTGTIGYEETGQDRFVSNDGTATYKVVTLAVTEDEAVDLVDDAKSAVSRHPRASRSR